MIATVWPLPSRPEAATPYALLDYAAFADGLSVDFTHLSAGHSGNLGVGWIYHLTRSLPNGLGLPLFVAAIGGLVPVILIALWGWYIVTSH